jgi:hypothetical protein
MTSAPTNYYTAWSSTAPSSTTPIHTQQNRRRHKLHLTPHTMCYGHQPLHLMKALPHTCKYQAVIHPSTCCHSPPLPLHTSSSLFICSTCSQNRIPHLEKLTHLAPSHTCHEAQPTTLQPMTTLASTNLTPLTAYQLLFIIR